MASCILPAAK